MADKSVVQPVSVSVETAPLPVATTTETPLRARFYAVDSKNPKSPAYRVEVSLPGKLAGLVLDCAIFADRDKSGAVTSYSVMMPGGSGIRQALRAEPLFVEHGGKKWPIKDAYNPQGAALLERWSPAIMTALYRFLQTQEPEQTLAEL